MGSRDCSFSLVSTNSQALVLSYYTRILWTSPLYDSCWLTGHFFRYTLISSVVSPCWTLSIFLWLLFCSETSGIPCAFWFSHLFSKAHLPFSFLSFVCSFHHFHDFIFHTWNSSDDSWIPFPSLSCLGLKPVFHVCMFIIFPPILWFLFSWRFLYS